MYPPISAEAGFARSEHFLPQAKAFDILTAQFSLQINISVTQVWLCIFMKQSVWVARPTLQLTRFQTRLAFLLSSEWQLRIELQWASRREHWGGSVDFNSNGYTKHCIKSFMFLWYILRNIIQAENFRDKLLEQCTITQALKCCHCKCQWFEWLIIHTQRINLTPPTIFFPGKIYNKSKREGLRMQLLDHHSGTLISVEGGKKQRPGSASFLRCSSKK